MVSERQNCLRKEGITGVLILVLVEDGLGDEVAKQPLVKVTVLILVLVEDGLGEVKMLTSAGALVRLNPCFSGGWSRSFFNK